MNDKKRQNKHVYKIPHYIASYNKQWKQRSKKIQNPKRMRIN